MPLKYPLISLRTRFMLIAVILTIGSSTIWGGWLWQREKSSLLDRASREGEMLVSTMAIPIINAILYEELGIIYEGGLLDSFIAEIMATPRLEVRYAFVLDAEGRVLAHNRLTEYGKIYQDPLTLETLGARSFQESLIQIGGERISDKAMPLAIAGKSWGSLRVGISMEPAFKELSRLGQRVIFFTALFSIGALLIYWFIGTWLARPIRALTHDMEKIDESLESPPNYRYRRDEIGLLQKSFYEMLQRLKTSETEREKSIARMLENERVAAIGRLVSGVAHEVNNPLAGIEGALYQIEQKSGPEIRRYAGLVRQSIERIGRIVSQLSDLSRAGTMAPRPVESQVLFEDIQAFALMAVKNTNCRLRCENLCPSITLIVDRDKIHQVILNLVLNAIDATCINYLCDSGNIELRATLDQGHYTLSVANTGPTIPEDVVGEIFTPFYTTKEPGKGSGMGLAISKGIAENHGGTLTFARIGEWTVFTLAIPCNSSMDSYS